MIPLIAKIGKTAKKVPGGPIVQGVVVLAFLLVSYLIVRALIRGVSNVADSIVNPPVNPSDLVDETPTADDTEMDEVEVDAFALTAQTIAQNQYNALNQSNVDEAALFMPLLNLNGTQLQAVFDAYGNRGGKNLFNWYADKLDSGMFTSLVYYCGWMGIDCEDGQVPGCETWFDNCYERDFMRSIWQKSGLPITF